MSLIVTGGCSKRKRTRQIIVRLDCRMGLVAVRTKQNRSRTHFSTHIAKFCSARRAKKRN